jgi:FkbM family methyltransferase
MSALRSISYVLNRFVLQRKFLLAEVGDLRFRVKTEDVVGRHIYKYGQHEPEMSAFLRHAVKVSDGDLLIDIGANIGWYSMLFDRLCGGTDAKVLSFEPDPTNYGMLGENIALNAASHVQPFQLGLSDNDAGAALHRFSDSNLGRHSMLPINDHGSVTVETARLDDLLATAGYAGHIPRLIKIDIEGFELVALRGAPATLRRCPLVILEYSPAYMRRGGIEPPALLNYMHELGFEAALLRDGTPQPVTIDELARSERQQDIIWTRPAA